MSVVDLILQVLMVDSSYYSFPTFRCHLPEAYYGEVKVSMDYDLTTRNPRMLPAVDSETLGNKNDENRPLEF